MTSEWGLYGRKKELDDLVQDLNKPGFRSIAIVGRRLAGRQMFMIELPEQPEPGENLPAAGRRFRTRMDKALTKAGVSIEEPPEDESLDPFTRQNLRCNHLVRTLIEHGVIVFLDEFHHAMKLGMESTYKWMIGRFRSPTRNETRRDFGNYLGKLVVAGSHQQQVLRMLENRKSLYGRGRGWIR